jgi:hypothetical protein
MEHFLFLRVGKLNLPSVPSHDNTMSLLIWHDSNIPLLPRPSFQKKKVSSFSGSFVSRMNLKR